MNARPATRVRVVRESLALLMLGGLLLAGVRPLGPVPPLGPFLDPVHGVWAVARAAKLPARHEVELPGLVGPVEVVVDHRGVPHVFAGREEDVHRATGWLVARDRLFQLEVQTRAGEGTLTELVGPGALDGDRFTRRLGLAWSAERKFVSLDTASVGYRAIVAYAAGVNAYLDQLGPDDLPLEYRLLGRSPRRFQPVHSAYLFARMGLTLAFDDAALTRRLAQALVGAEAAEAIVPLDNPIQEPIQPSRLGAPRFRWKQLPTPGLSDSQALVHARAAIERAAASRAGDAIGSNNWAVAPGRTRDGHTLLAGDPHLRLTLPSIWYEIHLTVPGRLDVAGVSLAGSPGVVIGFNRDLAWSFTNTGGDVLDRYGETVDDRETPSRYLLDGQWEPLTSRIEIYRGPDGELLAVDTVRSTHRGPMVREGGEWQSIRWTVHDPSHEADLFLEAAATTSVDDWLAVMRDYVAPTQNGLVAGRADIAIRASGRFPVRPGDGRGDRVLDGTTRANDWRGAQPVEHYPFAKNPSQGFLASANQQPIDPEEQNGYLGSDWIAPWRALRINALLRSDSAVTVDAMRRFQTDPGSARADLLVPAFLAGAGAVLASGEEDVSLRLAADLLRDWNRTYAPEDRHAVLFELAVREVERRTWDELRAPGSDRPAFLPSSSTLVELLQDRFSPWWDDRRTPAIEHRDQILATSLRAALDSARSRYGEPAGDGWRWDRIQTANVFHLLGIPALSALRVPARGAPGTLAPLSGRGDHAASWRMVVEVGDSVRAWATYPGGQSGNPASPRYDDRIPEWSRGELAPVLFPRSPDQLPEDRVISRLHFRPAP